MLVCPHMSYPVSESLIRKLLIGVSLFIFISAIAGAVGLIGGGINIPLSLIEGSVFSSYLIPGLVLGIVIGGTHLVAAFSVWKRRRFAADISAVAGFGLVIWIFVEMYIMEAAHWAHTLYFTCGIIMLALSFLLLRAERE